jgi:hypothetical protein
LWIVNPAAIRQLASEHAVPEDQVPAVRNCAGWRKREAADLSLTPTRWSGDHLGAKGLDFPVVRLLHVATTELAAR